MQEQYSIYLDHRKYINRFIKENISNLSPMNENEQNNFKSLFNLFNSLEFVYYCEYNEKEDTLLQVSDNIFRKKSQKTKNENKSHLLKKFKKFKNKDKYIYISKPYLSETTNISSIRVAMRENDKIYYLVFSLSSILQKLGFLEIHPSFTTFIRISYAIIGNLMIAFAGFAILYSLYEFFTFFLYKKLSIDFIFKPVITLTLGLAIFDLAKTILEQEVVFKKYSNNLRNDSRILTKFSTTIIVALLIESLMVVFKMAISESANMVQAFYLIAGVSFLIIALVFFIGINKYKNE